MMIDVNLNMVSLADRIGTEADAWLFLEELRWDGTPTCAHCGSERVYFLTPKNGVSRTTTRGTQSVRRVWKCGACRKQFSATSGTIFHGTKISLRMWLLVVFEMCLSKNGVAAREIERKYGLTPKSAWFMLHRIREAMKREPLVGLLRGTVVADETFIGGKPKNRHQQGRRRPGSGKGLAGPHATKKTPVLSLVNKETGEVRSHVIANIHGDTIREVIAQQVDMADTDLHTDAGSQYRNLGREMASHQWVSHLMGEYVRGEVSTNQAENFFSQLKRSIDGTHHNVSREHLGRYLAEFDYRYSTRELDDTARMRRLMGQVAGKRLSYRPLTGR